MPAALTRSHLRPLCVHCCADIHDVNVWKAHIAADKAAAAAATAADAAAADEAEALLEQQLEQMLAEGTQQDDDSLMDDYLDSDDALSSDDADDSDSSRDQQGPSTPTKQQPQRRQNGQQGVKQGAQNGNAVPKVSEAPPPSFCQVQLDLSESELRKRYPRFPGMASASVVVLQAGDMLYLPAGWFHEVTSYGGPGETRRVVRTVFVAPYNVGLQYGPKQRAPPVAVG
jgi:hypothetical protein